MPRCFLDLAFLFNLGLTFLLFSCGADRITESLKSSRTVDNDAVHFVVVAHPDDWQFFMGEYVYDLAIDGHTKVVIISTNSGGGAGSDFWQARELGGIVSVRAIFDFPSVEDHSSESTSYEQIAGASVFKQSIKNVDYYALRLPDGLPLGTAEQSMKKLWDGHISSIPTVDLKNNYSLDGLVSLLTEIILQQSDRLQKKMIFYTLDTGDGTFATHSDHIITFKLLQKTLTAIHPTDCQLKAFEDYRMRYKRENLSDEDHRKKLQVFSGYALVMSTLQNRCYLCSNLFTDWLKRSYHKEFTCP